MKKSAGIALVFGVFCLILGYFCSFFDGTFASSELFSRIFFTEIFSFSLKFFGFVTCFCSVAVLVFNKQISRYCSPTSFAMALVTALFAGVGLQCSLMLLGNHLISDPAKTPVSDFVGALGLSVCMLLGIVMILVYSFYRNKHPSGVGVVIDITFGLLYILPFMFAFSSFYKAVEVIVRHCNPDF